MCSWGLCYDIYTCFSNRSHSKPPLPTSSTNINIVRNGGRTPTLTPKLSRIQRTETPPPCHPPAATTPCLAAESRPSSAMSSSRTTAEDLSSALRQFSLSTAESRENLRASRQDVGVLEDIAETVRSLVRSRYGDMERSRKMTM